MQGCLAEGGRGELQGCCRSRKSPGRAQVAGVQLLGSLLEGIWAVVLGVDCWMEESNGNVRVGFLNQPVLLCTWVSGKRSQCPIPTLRISCSMEQQRIVCFI